MNNKIFICLVFCLALIFGCGKDAPVSQELIQSAQASAQSEQASDAKIAGEGTQISGLAYYAQPGECEAGGEGADYVLTMTGDFEGCVFTFIDKSECVNGCYYEEGREHFVGTYKGKRGSFWTNYKSLGKYEGCSGGAPTGAEILGFCVHPLVRGSGEGAFEGASGRYFMIDKVKAGNFPYRGTLKF
jgi:hypothetical protein